MAMVSEQREVRDFQAVELRGHGVVHVTQGDREALVVEADERTIADVETEVVRGVLRLGMKTRWGFSWKPGPVTFTVSARDIRSLRVSGSGDIRTPRIHSDEFDLRISGSGEIEVDDLTALSVKAEISGSGDLIVMGTTDRLRASISGSGRIRAERLEADRAEVNVTGSGDAFVHATSELDIRISGSGDVRYVGSPRLRMKTSGSGRVHQIDPGTS